MSVRKLGQNWLITSLSYWVIKIQIYLPRFRYDIVLKAPCPRMNWKTKQQDHVHNALSVSHFLFLLRFSLVYQGCQMLKILDIDICISSQSLNLDCRRGTTDDVATIPFHLSLSSTALRESPNPIPVHSLMLTFHLFFSLPLLLAPFTVLCRIVFAMPEGHEMWPYHLHLSPSIDW